MTAAIIHSEKPTLAAHGTEIHVHQSVRIMLWNIKPGTAGNVDHEWTREEQMPAH